VAPDANASLHRVTIFARRRGLLCGLLAAAILAGCGGAKVGAPATGSTKRNPGARGNVHTGAQQTPGKTNAEAGSDPARTAAGTPHEIADPEEANSFPAPADVRHSAAKAPVKAAEAIVAAGAPSDAEVRAELAQMQAAEKSAKRARGKRLVPVPGGESIGGDGQLPIPPGVPEVVQKVIAGANEIADFPYVFGGGHASFIDNAYDCSGSVSYALAAGGLLSSPETSGELEKWGVPGPGRYITVLANAGHTYMYVDGILFDTAGRSGVYASRWQVTGTDNSGYVVRHWPGL
jgi:cell wall-associated NlpC family hydrolase